MAQCLLGVIEDYETKEKLSPDHKVPFCLRYPTLKSLEELVKANEKKMKRVRYEKAVIFLDGAKRTIGIFIPPVKDEVVVKKVLGQDPRESYRLFPVPGMGHCCGGPGPSNIHGAGQKDLPKNSTSQSFSFLPEDNMILGLIEWTENGKSPDYLVATKFLNGFKDEGVSKYNGYDNSNSHHSYQCKDQ
ncbi:hypothetical protein DFH28DRAFT_931956 [Melampsora americana]|nr:hypothetical protein DFH28DRAFT_931956 [Melampsora americana]